MTDKLQTNEPEMLSELHTTLNTLQEQVALLQTEIEACLKVKVHCHEEPSEPTIPEEIGILLGQIHCINEHVYSIRNRVRWSRLIMC